MSLTFNKTLFSYFLFALFCDFLLEVSYVIAMSTVQCANTLKGTSRGPEALQNPQNNSCYKIVLFSIALVGPKICKWEIFAVFLLSFQITAVSFCKDL